MYIGTKVLLGIILLAVTNGILSYVFDGAYPLIHIVISSMGGILLGGYIFYIMFNFSKNNNPQHIERARASMNFIDKEQLRNQ